MTVNFQRGVDEGFILDDSSVWLKGEVMCHTGRKRSKLCAISP